jgi:hypothetical protein
MPGVPLTPDADPSAEMEALRLRRTWRAFIGTTDDEGRSSPLSRGLALGVVLSALVLVGAGVGGVVQGTWTQLREDEQKQQEQQRPPPPAAVAGPGTSPSTTPRSTTAVR